MQAGFRGASAEQDLRFGDKLKKQLKATKFPASFDQKVDMSKVQMDTMLPWITEQVTKYLGFEDEVVIGYIKGSLEKPKVDPKVMQLNLQGFLNDNTKAFMRELWRLMLSAQESDAHTPPGPSASHHPTRGRDLQMWMVHA